MKGMLPNTLQTIDSLPRIDPQFTIVRGHPIPTYPTVFPQTMFSKRHGMPCMALLNAGKINGPQF